MEDSEANYYWDLGSEMLEAQKEEAIIFSVLPLNDTKEISCSIGYLLCNTL